MKTRPYLKKLLRVVLTSLIYIGLFLVIYYLLLFISGIRYPLPALLISLVISIYFHEQITWQVRQFLDKNLYRKIYRTNISLNNFNSELNSTLEQSLLLEKFSAFLYRTFPENSWTWYFCWGEDFELFESNKIESSIPKLVKLPAQTVLDTLLKSGVECYPLQRLKQREKAFSESMQFFPDTEQFRYFIPLKSYSSYIGFLTFDLSLSYFLNFWELKNSIIKIFNKTADVFENAQLYSEAKRKSLQNYLLVEIGKKISASLNLNELLETIIDSIKRIVNYDAAGIFLVDKQNSILRHMVTRGYDKGMLDKVPLKISEGLSGKAIRTKQPSLINDVFVSKDYFPVRESTRSQLTVPMLEKGEEALGVIALESDKINHFTPSDQELLMTYASQAEIAIENAQLFEESLQKKRLESELVIASKVQKALLPERPPNIAGFKIGFFNIPSRIVGGDFYDVFRIGESNLGVAIGDVSGKGAPASILMAMLYAGFRSLLKEIYPVVEVVARLNNLLTETTTEGYYVTFFFGIIDRDNLILTFCNAGHNPPILLKKNNTVQRLKTGGIVLGFLKDQEYKQESIQLVSGDVLVLFTDGVTEVKNCEGEEFGEERLINFIIETRNINPAELKRTLLKELKDFSAQKDLPDDVTLSVINVE